MKISSIGALAVLLAFAWQARAENPQASHSPQLQLIQMTGKLSVQTPTPLGETPSQGLPFIPPDSQVRVLSGIAWFESDNHALIRAKAGDSFLYKASPAQARIGVPELSQGSLEVRLGGAQFLLSEGGALSFASAGDGQIEAKVQGGRVEVIPGSSLKSGESIFIGGSEKNGSGMDAGATVLIQSPPETPDLGSSLDLARLKVVRKDANAFTAEASGPGEAPGLEMKELAGNAIAHWPSLPALTGNLMVEKYGPPQALTGKELIWRGNSPWKTTIVNGRKSAGGVLRQTIGYAASRDKVAALESLALGLEPDPEHEELSVTSDSEAKNFLALNLAHQVVAGKLTVDAARQAYANTLALESSGKSSPYMTGLMFKPLE